MLTAQDIMNRYEQKKRDILIAKYCNDGLTVKDVAKRFMLSKYEVRKICTAQNVKKK